MTKTEFSQFPVTVICQKEEKTVELKIYCYYDYNYYKNPVYNETPQNNEYEMKSFFCSGDFHYFNYFWIDFQNFICIDFKCYVEV